MCISNLFWLISTLFCLIEFIVVLFAALFLIRFIFAFLFFLVAKSAFAVPSSLYPRSSFFIFYFLFCFGLWNLQLSGKKEQGAWTMLNSLVLAILRCRCRFDIGVGCSVSLLLRACLRRWRRAVF